MHRKTTDLDILTGYLEETLTVLMEYSFCLRPDNSVIPDRFMSGKVREWISQVLFHKNLSNDAWRNLRLFAGFLNEFYDNKGFLYEVGKPLYEQIKSDDFHPLDKDVQIKQVTQLKQIDLQMLLLAVGYMQFLNMKRIPTRKWLEHRKAAIQAQEDVNIVFVYYQKTVKDYQIAWQRDAKLFYSFAEFSEVLKMFYNGNQISDSFISKLFRNHLTRNYTLNDFITVIDEIEKSKFVYKNDKAESLSSWLLEYRLTRKN